MAEHVRFDRIEDAAEFSAAVDEAMGYPRAGVDVGGGQHAPAEMSQTLRYADVDKHPTEEKWGYPFDVQIAALVEPEAPGEKDPGDPVKPRVETDPGKRRIEEKGDDWDRTASAEAAVAVIP